MSEEWTQIRKPPQQFWGPAVFRLGLVYNPTCDWCKLAFETACHVLCDCEALTALRFRHQAQHFVMTLPSVGFSYSVQIAGVLNGWAIGLHKTSSTVQAHVSLWCPPFCILFLGSVLSTGPSRCGVCGALTCATVHASVTYLLETGGVH